MRMWSVPADQHRNHSSVCFWLSENINARAFTLVVQFIYLLVARIHTKLPHLNVSRTIVWKSQRNLCEVNLKRINISNLPSRVSCTRPPMPATAMAWKLIPSVPVLQSSFIVFADRDRCFVQEYSSWVEKDESTQPATNTVWILIKTYEISAIPQMYELMWSRCLSSAFMRFPWFTIEHHNPRIYIQSNIDSAWVVPCLF